MATVLIIGASRGIGLETVKLALEQGRRVRALARDTGAMDVQHTNLEKIDGDATDPKVLAAVVRGVDAVISALGVSNPLTLKPVVLFSRSTRHLITAMRDAGVKRLIAVTGFGAGDSRGKGNPLYTKLAFPLLLGRVYEDKDVQEDYIRKSGLDWTIVRPGLLTGGARTGNYRVITDPSRWDVGFISRADVAEFLVRQVEDRTYIGATPLLIR